MFAMLLETLSRKNLVPRLSDTERAALEAGDVWLDGDLFSGRPDFRRMLDASYPELRADERAFLDGPVEEVCASLDPLLYHQTRELPDTTWTLLRRHRFFGLGLPERYDGHGFSSLAQSSIFGKLATHSPSLSSVVVIPNSVGPGELLLEIGTDEQRDEYLPRLARGEEIPCFALTEPQAGSDVSSIRARGDVFKGRDGELMIRLDWDKRYITLAPIATLIGLAFRLYDPNHLLGNRDDIGITCALVASSLPGVEIGLRHDPLGLPFPNGPIRGRGVEIPLGKILGGPAYAGRGWPLLMEALAGGRGVSLPAQATAGAKYAARVVGAYSVVRQQFGTAIGRFAGIEEPLARLAGLSYLLEASRVLTCGAIDAGHRPAVISALMKYNHTELMRQLISDAMDVSGGAGICRGPRNLLADAYLLAPIGITVEGANILTRTLIVFGQGAIRSHPWAYRLLDAAQRNDARAFRAAFLRQAWHSASNLVRTLLYGLTGGRPAKYPAAHPLARYYRRLAWAAARFALFTDLALLSFGGGLKTHGKLTGRFADMLSGMYLAFACLRRFEAEGRRSEDLPLVRWAVEHSLERIQRGYEGILHNFDVPLLGGWLRGPVALWARMRPMGRPPADRLGSQVAQILRQPGVERDRLTGPVFMPRDPDHALCLLERAFTLTAESRPAMVKIKGAIRRRELPKAAPESLIGQALEKSVITTSEANLLRRAATARERAIEVDSFSLQELTLGTAAQTAPSPRTATG